MKLESIAAAIEAYERKTGEKFDLKPDLHIKILPSNEFLLWKIGSINGLRFMWLDQTYGYLENFAPFIKEVCRLNEVNYILAGTARNPKAFIRKYKVQHLPEYDYTFNGKHYYVLKGDVRDY